MGRNSAGVKAGTNDGGGQYKGKISRVGSLVEMKDKAMYKATKEAISRYHAVMGVRQRNVHRIAGTKRDGNADQLRIHGT